jgi:hypothetical protein
MTTRRITQAVSMRVTARAGTARDVKRRTPDRAPPGTPSR